MKFFGNLIIALTLIAGIQLSAADLSAAEEKTVDAFSVFYAKGQLFKSGSDGGTFVGTLEGPFLVQTPDGPVQAGYIVCAGMVDVDLNTAGQEGKGRCTITGEKGDQVYANWACEGYHLVGCKGDFKLTGGTGRFEKVTGGGPIRFRSGMRKIIIDASGNAAIETAGGIATLQGLKYKLP
jgi:hypothetical protein